MDFAFFLSFFYSFLLSFFFTYFRNGQGQNPPSPKGACPYFGKCGNLRTVPYNFGDFFSFRSSLSLKVSHCFNVWNLRIKTLRPQRQLLFAPRGGRFAQVLLYFGTVGLYAIVLKIATQTISLWIELGGKLKLHQLNFRYNRVLCTIPIGKNCAVRIKRCFFIQSELKHAWPDQKRD